MGKKEELWTMSSRNCSEPDSTYQVLHPVRTLAARARVRLGCGCFSGASHICLIVSVFESSCTGAIQEAALWVSLKRNSDVNS